MKTRVTDDDSFKKVESVKPLPGKPDIPPTKNPFTELNNPKYTKPGGRRSLLAEKELEELPDLEGYRKQVNTKPAAPMADPGEEVELSLNIPGKTGSVIEADASNPQQFQKPATPATVVETKTTVQDVNVPEDEYVARAATTLGPDWIRQDLPSKCIPYDFHDVHLHTLSIRALGTMHASIVHQSFTLMLDALDSCISVDIRDLTPNDLTHIMYWVRENSYPKSVFKIPHVTVYGNSIQIPIATRNLKTTYMNMTKEEALEWRAKGIWFPTVRDMELIHNNPNIPPEKEFLLDYAQYVDVKVDPEDYDRYTEIKIDALDKLGLEILKEIDTFADLTRHGVEELTTIRDPEFEPGKAIAFFENQATDILKTLDSIPLDQREDLVGTIIEMTALADDLKTKAQEIRETLAKGEKFIPIEETVAVKISATDFFP